MKSKIFWLMLSCLMVLSMVLASCGTKTTPTTTPTTKPTTTSTFTPTSTPTTTPTTTATGNWWDVYGVPQYGDTITIRWSADPTSFDVYFRGSGDASGAEPLFRRNTSIDPKIWDFTTKFNDPKYNTSNLADSWEMPDLATLILHMHPGVHYWDRAPMNGREFNADDVVYNFHRLLGIGSGFSKPTPYTGLGLAMPTVTSVTAPDKYTVVFKASKPSLPMYFEPSDPYNVWSPIQGGREIVEKYGDLTVWSHCVGTGPFMIIDYVSGSSISFIKNPNYWNNDSRYPQNKLPYADALKYLIIPDDATALAALRTGKIDLIENLSLRQSKSLSQTNPELKQLTRPLNPSVALGMRVDKAPFTDIRVRKAMQMAMDLKTIAATYYGGVVDPTPIGLIYPGYTGYCTPYSEWDADVKAGYAYNPDGARKLLTEAGFPKGFKTNMVATPIYDLDIFEVIKSYLAAIGIDMTIQVMDNTAYTAFLRAEKQDALFVDRAAAPITPYVSIQYRRSKQAYDYVHAADPIYDNFYDKAQSTTDKDEQRSLIKQADYEAIKQQWVVCLPLQISYCVYQPYLAGGYTGQQTMGSDILSRFWIDLKLKRAMGR